MIIRYDDGSHRLTAACLIDFMTTPTEGAHSLARLHASAVAGIVLHGARRTATAIVEIELFLERRTYNIRKPSVSD